MMKPDADAMIRHVIALFGTATEGQVELAWIEKGRGSGAQLFALDQVEKLVECAIEWSTPGRNVYLGATLKHPDVAPFGRTKDDEALAAPAFWLDLDEPGEVERAEKLARHYRPTLKVTTGTVPDVRQHWWWVLAEPVVDMERVRAQEAALAAHLGGDPKVCNPGRIMRLAGSIAWPTKPGRIAQLVTLQNGGPTYTAEQIAYFVPPAAAAPSTPTKLAPPPRANSPMGSGSLGILLPKIEDGREEYMVRTIAACLREFIGANGAVPSEDELFDAAWPQYDRKVNWQSRPGRGPDEFRQKVAATLRRFRTGRIRGLRNEEEAVASHAARKGADRAQGAGNGREEALRARPRFKVFYAGDAEPTEGGNDFVEGLLVQNSLALFYGASGCGKSFIATDIALHVAAGMPWQGREVDQGAVLYIPLEGGGAFRNRVAAWLEHHRIPADNLPFAYMPATLDIMSNAEIGAVIAAADEVRQRTGTQLQLIVVDTLSRALAGGDENNPKDMGAAVRGLDKIREATGACILTIHHQGKDAQRGARGHSSLRAAVDTEVAVDRPEGSPSGTVRITKSRDFADDGRFSFSLTTIDLGVNRRGKPLTSCVAIPADEPPLTKGPRLKGAPEIARRALMNALAKDGVRVTRDGVPNIPTVSMERWKVEAYSMGIAGGDTSSDARRKAFTRAVQKLCGDGIAAVRDDVAWLCS
jgi:hypothetical protein